MFATLKKLGVLGINRRVGEYILPYNDRRYYPLVDSKIETYKLAKQYSIPQPEHYFHVTGNGEIKSLLSQIKDLQSFVIKPCRGAMGNGIEIVHDILWDHEAPKLTRFQTSKGLRGLKDLSYFISDILSGLYSLSGLPDQAIIQEKLEQHSSLSDYSYKGIMDIRIIVFCGYPVMAMLRCPTKESRGRANLHQGAVGCGINIHDGKICGAIIHNREIQRHPDTKHLFSELSLPRWKEILHLASKCYKMTQMGYLGVDVVLDELRGPLLLEINARPGLSIQVANKKGLWTRLEAIKKLPHNLSENEKIELSMKTLQEMS